MPYATLQEFIADLDRLGELKRIRQPVDPYLEITEIADRVMKAGGPALPFDARTLGMHWQLHKVGAEHHRAAQAAGRRIEVAVALGGDPALTYAATAPLPPQIDEILFTGWLRGKGVDLVQCETVDLQVPAG